MLRSNDAPPVTDHSTPPARRAGAATRPLSRRAVLLLGGLALAACGRTVRYSQPQPGFLRYRADDVVGALTAAGLPISQVESRPIATATPYPEIRQPLSQAPKLPIEPTVEVEIRTFVIPQLGDRGGQILIFDSAERLHAKRVWFARFPDRNRYVYAYENVLLTLDNSLTPAEADRYRAALETLP